MKYIVFGIDGKEAIFVFPRSVDHDRMAEGCQAIRFGDNQNWARKLRTGSLISAGFIKDGACCGESETLKLKSRGEIDTALFKASMAGK